MMNPSQRGQLTGSAWLTVSTEAAVCVSIVGRGRYFDNVLLEHFWRSFKKEAVYLEEIQDGFRVSTGWMSYDNTKQLRSTFDWLTTDDAFWAA